MRPICVACKREMCPIKNEFMVKDRAVGRFPSTVWSGDLYECPECKAQIVTGFGRGRSITRMGEADLHNEAMEFTR